MTLRDRREQLKGAFRASLSPPAWKDQLKQRCMQRLRQDRHLLLAKLRSPDAARSVSDEMKRLVQSEQQRRHPVFDMLQHENSSGGGSDDSEDDDMRDDAAASDLDDEYASIEELVAAGRLAEADYLEIVHALEDELLEETLAPRGGDEDQLVEHMVEFEEASLDAMLASLDLSVPDDFFEDEFDIAEPSPCGNGIFVLCPICKVGAVTESPSVARFPALSCACGFAFQTTQEPLHGALEDFQELIATAFMAHRERCLADPRFEKTSAAEGTGPRDAIRIQCFECHASYVLQ
ncbi:hypothetical protein PybrP1_009594 [[Pythium] brassicae (nom. inval.)]|nr:hypothetical protein PybrP1_009594 [[Pythium] brassicae (nom. inval.)]